MIRILRQGVRSRTCRIMITVKEQVCVCAFLRSRRCMCTTTGTSILAYTSRCALVPGSGFLEMPTASQQIMADESIEENYPQKDEKAAAAYMNSYLEDHLTSTWAMDVAAQTLQNHGKIQKLNAAFVINRLAVTNRAPIFRWENSSLQ